MAVKNYIFSCAQIIIMKTVCKIKIIVLQISCISILENTAKSFISKENNSTIFDPGYKRTTKCKIIYWGAGMVTRVYKLKIRIVNSGYTVYHLFLLFFIWGFKLNYTLST